MICILYCPFKSCGFGECALSIAMSHQKKDVVISMFCPMVCSSILEYQKIWRKNCGQVVPLETKVIGHWL
jgi:hypothetical protein